MIFLEDIWIFGEIRERSIVPPFIRRLKQYIADNNNRKDMRI